MEIETDTKVEYYHEPPCTFYPPSAICFFNQSFMYSLYTIKCAHFKCIVYILSNVYILLVKPYNILTASYLVPLFN